MRLYGMPDRHYYAARAVAEEAAAGAATSPEARLVHLQLVDQYSAIVAEMDRSLEQRIRSRVRVSS
jgi:hypothetical protein